MIQFIESPIQPIASAPLGNYFDSLLSLGHKLRRDFKQFEEAKENIQFSDSFKQFLTDESSNWPMKTITFDMAHYTNFIGSVGEYVYSQADSNSEWHSAYNHSLDLGPDFTSNQYSAEVKVRIFSTSESKQEWRDRTAGKQFPLSKPKLQVLFSNNPEEYISQNKGNGLISIPVQAPKVEKEGRGQDAIFLIDTKELKTWFVNALSSLRAKLAYTFKQIVPSLPSKDTVTSLMFAGIAVWRGLTTIPFYTHSIASYYSTPVYDYSAYTSISNTNTPSYLSQKLIFSTVDTRHDSRFLT